MSPLSRRLLGPASPSRGGWPSLGWWWSFPLQALPPIQGRATPLSSEPPASPEFLQHNILVRFLLLGGWGKVLFAKYIAFWLTAEGVCVLAGLGYNGVREADGKADWSGCANVRVRRLETASKFSHLIESFNINTNGWAASYVYKRLKFMDNRIISQVATLVFLSVWHGFHSGYHLTFFTEFMTVNMEKELLAIAGKSEKVARWMSHPGRNISFT